MKSLYKTIKIVGIVIIIVLLSCAIAVHTLGPKLTNEAEQTIEQAIDNPLPIIIKGKTDIAESNGTKIWYESISPTDSVKGSVLLIMGISNDALAWPNSFIESFLNSGYRVIRFDHRGTGMSDWLEDWTPDNAYSLSDMANDCVAILDSLSLQKAHIVGVSMGGMIAQQFVINHPDRSLSLASIMSSGDIIDNELPSISADISMELIKVYLRYGLFADEESLIKLNFASRIILMGNCNYKFDYKEMAESVLYNIRNRNGYNFNVSQQHQTAVYLSGSRYEGLRKLTVPSIVIHGKCDPFIPIEHGKKCAATIPDADSLWLDGLGHDIPYSFSDTISSRIIQNFKRLK